MLSLEKVTGTCEHVHAESGAVFHLNPITAKRYQSIKAQCTKNGTTDTVELAGKLAKEAISTWEGVGGECTDPNKIKFGEKFAFTIMPGITDAAMEFATKAEAEVEAGKKD